MEEKNNQKNKLIRGFLFACTNKSEEECVNGPVFATDKIYGPIVIRVRKGDLLFLNNIDTNSLLCLFEATSDGEVNIKKDAFGGKYPYQVEKKALGDIITLPNVKKILKDFNFKRNTPLFNEKLVDFLYALIYTQNQLNESTRKNNELILEIIQKIKENKADIDIEEEIPLIESTTLWDFPKQSYGIKPKGNNKYAGVTPALIIYNMMWRYTEPGDLVVDPMCGSGTTIDVGNEEKRRVIGYDIVPARPDIIQNDARHIPLENNSADMIFIDSPYGDNIKYNNHPDNIGHISAESDEFYDELEKVMQEAHRILKEGKVLGWLIGDQWVHGMFTPVGFRIYESLCKYFEPVDLICVTRKSQYSNTGLWHNRARKLNFYLRGFKHLIIVRKVNLKDSKAKKAKRPQKVNWTYYERD
jgi:DNA modification methylase